MSDDGILRLQFPALHLAQQQVMDDPHRFKVVACGRRFGKTTLGISAASRTALVGGSVAWCGPTYRMVVDAWEQFCHLLHPATARRNEAEHRLHLITGGMISCWSLDAPDTVRGSAYARIIIDEAAMVPHLDRVWQQILRPTLTDYRGDAWFLSTPRGLGYFHSLFQAGLVPQDGVGDGQGDGRAWASFSFPSSANPHLPTDDVDEARAQLSERDYAQEYLGQFLETDGSVFTNVLSCIVDALPQAWQPGHEYLLGVDWGRLQDATACVVLDITAEPKAVVAERNAAGDPLTEQLRRSSRAGASVYHHGGEQAARARPADPRV